MTAKDTVVAMLPALTTAERTEVIAACKALDQFGAGTADRALGSVSDDWLLSGIAAHLATRGLLPTGTAMFELRRRNAYKQYQAKLPDVMQYLTKLEADNLLGTRSRVTLSFLCARSLETLLTKRNYFSVGAMLSQVDKIPEALDECFPGYVYAKLFGFFIRGLEKGTP